MAELVLNQAHPEVAQAKQRWTAHLLRLTSTLVPISVGDWARCHGFRVESGQTDDPKLG